MKTILITGATGFVGRRLLYSLLDEDIKIRLLVRNKNKLESSFIQRCEVYEGDTFNIDVLNAALSGVNTAIYLIHMMGKDENYTEKEKASAENFRICCEKNSVRQIIYLGSLGESDTDSPHIKSRLMTGEILGRNPERVSLAWFRAAVIIGSGSASFEIIRNLVEKLPVMIAPRWVNTETCPIYIDDVIEYLKAAILSKSPIHAKIDIGMSPTTFKQMLLDTAEVMGLKRIIITVPVLTPRLSSYWLILFTPVNFDLARELVLGLKTRTVKTNRNAEYFFPDIKVKSFKESIKKAIDEIETNQVISRWCDSSKGLVCDVPQVPDIAKAVYQYSCFKHIDKPLAHKIFETCKTLGGSRGWYAFDFLWSLRGFVDKLLGGYGLSRGRRLDKDLRVGDVIDFWKVIDIVEGERLLLESQMKIPGRAWLEFTLLDDKFNQTAYFYPKGLSGRVYWFALLPVHKLIFKKMINNIVSISKKNIT